MPESPIPEHPPCYSPKTLAQRWECSAEHVCNLITRKEIACFRVGRLLRITAYEVERFEREGEESRRSSDIVGPIAPTGGRMGRGRTILARWQARATRAPGHAGNYPRRRPGGGGRQALPGCPVSNATIDALAAFEAEGEDMENEPDEQVNEDGTDESSLDWGSASSGYAVGDY